jgi:hypothetical protein
MTPLIYAAMIGGIPLSLLVFFALPKRRAVLTCYIGLWLFLPNYTFTFSGIPDYDKVVAVNLAVFLGVVLTDFSRLTRFRARFWDALPLFFLILPMSTAVSNNLGLWEGISSTFITTITWVVPYFIGRLYFQTLEDFRELAFGIYIAGLIYVPLALFEFRMAPVLHNLVYGFNQHQFIQTLRGGGGYRPMVFLQHGLAVGMLLTASFLCGYWLWRRGTLRTLWTIPVYYFLILHLAVTLYARSYGALILLAGGLFVLEASRVLNTRVLLLIVALIPPLYVSSRASGLWDGYPAPAIVEQVFGARRASSLNTRLENENLMVARAHLRPIFGWGRFGRSRLTAYGEREATAVDSLWIIFFGRGGVTRLLFYFLIFLLPIALLAKIPTTRLLGGSCAGLLSASMVLLLSMMDNMVNAMYNPIFLLVPGALIGTLAGVPAPRGTESQAPTPERLTPTPTGPRSGWVSSFNP